MYVEFQSFTVIGGQEFFQSSRHVPSVPHHVLLMRFSAYFVDSSSNSVCYVSLCLNKSGTGARVSAISKSRIQSAEFWRCSFWAFLTCALYDIICPLNMPPLTPVLLRMPFLRSDCILRI